MLYSCIPTTLLQDGGSILRRLSLAPTVWLLSTLVALFVSLVFRGLACSSGLTEEDVRQIVEEHSAPVPIGPQDPKGGTGEQGPAWGAGARL